MGNIQVQVESIHPRVTGTTDESFAVAQAAAATLPRWTVNDNRAAGTGWVLDGPDITPTTDDATAQAINEEFASVVGGFVVADGFMPGIDLQWVEHQVVTVSLDSTAPSLGLYAPEGPDLLL